MKYEPIEIIPDEEILDIIRSEQARLGDNLLSFTITWFRAEFEYRLELDSDSKSLILGKSGMVFCLGTAPLEDYIKNKNLDSLDRVITTGRQLYYRIRKYCPLVKRELGKTGFKWSTPVLDDESY